MRQGERMAENKDDLSIKSSLGVQDQRCRPLRALAQAIGPET